MGSKKIAAWALGITLAASTGLLMTATAAQALPVAEQVTFCHAAPPDAANQFIEKTSTDLEALAEGGHALQHEDDIIPAFAFIDEDGEHVEFPGQNLDNAALVALAEADGCVVVVIIIVVVDETTTASTTTGSTSASTSSSPPLGLPTTSSSATASSSATSSAPSTTVTTTTKPPTTTVTTTTATTTTAPASTTVVAGPPLGGGVTPVAVPRAPTPVLAQTGFDTAGFASAGLGLLALGSAFLLAARRVDPSA